MKVTNMINNNGNKVKNQFEIVGLSAGTFYHNNEKLKIRKRKPIPLFLRA